MTPCDRPARPRRISLTPLLALLLVPACGDEGADAPGDAPSDARPPADTSTAPGPAAGSAPGGGATSGEPVDLPTILSRPYERDAGGRLVVLDELPTPVSSRAEAVQNRHDPGRTDTVRTLGWDGLELEVWKGAGGKEILQTVRVTGGEHATADGLGPGATRARVRDLRGEPDRTEGDLWVYEVLDDEHDPTPTILRVAFEDERVSSLEWSYYVD